MNFSWRSDIHAVLEVHLYSRLEHHNAMEITKNKNPWDRLKLVFVQIFKTNHTLGYEFFWNHKHLAKVFWFADFFLEILKIHRLVWIFPWPLVALYLFHQCFILYVQIFTFVPPAVRVLSPARAPRGLHRALFMNLAPHGKIWTKNAASL
jgi:hypothetical protein